jgi:hypothetical protein
MSVVVAYPVEIASYSVSIQRTRATVTLEGMEIDEESTEHSGDLRRVGVMVFGDPNPVADHDFITRGGFLHMDRSLDMLPAVLQLLTAVEPLYLNGEGVLSTEAESIGDLE